MAGIPREIAPTIGISVDHRRANLSVGPLALNVERLKAYRSRLILFPRKANKPKKADSSKEDIAAFTSGDVSGANRLRTLLPTVDSARQEAISEIPRSEMGEGTKDAYRVLREKRSEARLVGVREKRAKAKADEANAAKK